MDWKIDIAKIAYWKQLAAEADQNHALPWNLPRVGATAARIDAAEDSMGVRFSPDFKRFLEHADGWKGFCVLTDLFGTEEFIDGRAKAVASREDVHGFFQRNGIGANEALPIGASDFDLDVFLHFSPSSNFLPGGVLWLATEEVDRYATFSDFLSAMVNYNARIARNLGAEGSPPL